MEGKEPKRPQQSEDLPWTSTWQQWGEKTVLQKQAQGAAWPFGCEKEEKRAKRDKGELQESESEFNNDK